MSRPELPSSGVVGLAKSAGPTSRDVVNHVQRVLRRALGQRQLKVGHAGTLDPMATGVLVIAWGAATRLVPYLQEGRKEYVASFRLGWVSDTDDITGTVTKHNPDQLVSDEDLTFVLREFIGDLWQRPPRVSAVHVDGERAHALARRGEDFELAPRLVQVHDIQLLERSGSDFTLRINCGSGTYVRSIGRDVGERLGCGAMMTTLVRTAVGTFRIDEALPEAEVTPESLAQFARPLSRAIDTLPIVTLAETDATRVRHGQALADAACPLPGQYQLHGPDGDLVAIAVWDADRRLLLPKVVFPADMG